jgi:dihydrofolate synthase/folylpolyglutamate synthase
MRIVSQRSVVFLGLIILTTSAPPPLKCSMKRAAAFGLALRRTAAPARQRRYFPTHKPFLCRSKPPVALPATAIPPEPTTKQTKSGRGVTNICTTSIDSPSKVEVNTSSLPFAMPDMADPGHTTYEKLVRRLYMTNLFHPVKLGLENIERLHEVLGSPLDNPNLTIIHIAGTNGKGSVALKIAKSLEEADGNTVGLFISPHVSSFRERMQVNSELMTEADVEDRLPRIFSACEEHSIPATFFEVTTALAFLHFAESGCNVIVLETGLGGRLDATNIVKEPAISVITSIGLEHTRILGETVEEIALEKGGIIKKDRPVLVGPNVPLEVLKECAREKASGTFYEVKDVLGTGNTVNSDSEDEGKFVDYDAENSRIARAALEILRRQNHLSLHNPTEEDITRGTGVRPPCRFEHVEAKSDAGDPVHVILDVAHNPDAMVQLVSKLERAYPFRKKRIVCGFSSDKDLSACGRALLSTVGGPSRIHLVEAAHPRAAKLEDMLDAEPMLKDANFDEKDRSVAAQVKSGLQLAAEGNELLIVCGSVFLMAEAREALGFDEPRDSEYIAEVAGANLRHGQENFADTDPEKEKKR